MLETIQIPENRLKHCYVTGKVMQWCAKHLGCSIDEQMRMFFIGYGHDCMYDFEDDGVGTHDDTCAGLLRGTGMDYAIERHMALPTPEEVNSPYQKLSPEVPIEHVELFCLRFADAIVDGAGEVVGFNRRVQDLEARHKDDNVVEEALAINNYLFAHGARELERECLKAFGIDS